MTVEPGAIVNGETRCRVTSAQKARISRGRGLNDIQFDMACSRIMRDEPSRVGTTIYLDCK